MVTQEAGTAAFMPVWWQRLAGLYLNRWFLCRGRNSAGGWCHFYRVSHIQLINNLQGMNCVLKWGGRSNGSFLSSNHIYTHQCLRHRYKTDKVKVVFVTVAGREIAVWDKSLRSITSVLTRQPRGWTSRGLDRRRGKTPKTNLPKSDKSNCWTIILDNIVRFIRSACYCFGIS